MVSTTSGGDDTNVGLIVGVVIGSLVLLLIIVLIIWLLFCRDEDKDQDNPEQVEGSNGGSKSNQGLIVDGERQNDREEGAGDGEGANAAGVAPSSAWRERTNDPKDDFCTLCENDQTDFRSNCGHYFHIECISDHSKER